MVHGADDYITKPFQYEELIEGITAVMAKRAALAEQLRRHTEEHRRELAAPWGHELLTPLNGILGAAALLESEFATISRPELRELAASIRVSAERQLALARKLMQHFQLEQLIEQNWNDLHAAVDAGTAVEDEATVAAKQANRTADLRLVCTPAAVRISPAWLQSAVAELVENAFKFSPAGSPVTVTGRVEEGLYRIEVSDRGPACWPRSARASRRSSSSAAPSTSSRARPRAFARAEHRPAAPRLAEPVARRPGWRRFARGARSCRWWSEALNRFSFSYSFSFSFSRRYSGRRGKRTRKSRRTRTMVQTCSTPVWKFALGVGRLASSKARSSVRARVSCGWMIASTQPRAAP